MTKTSATAASGAMLTKPSRGKTIGSVITRLALGSLAYVGVLIGLGGVRPREVRELARRIRTNL